MFKLVLEKAEEPVIKLPTSAGSWKKQESSRKTSTSALLTTPKTLCGSQQTVANCMQVKKQQLEPDVEQWTGLGNLPLPPPPSHHTHNTHTPHTHPVALNATNVI